LNAVQSINPKAVAEADRLDAAFTASGPVGPLHCVPILVKDQLETSDMPTTYGSAVFKDFIPERDATIVTKLKKAGATQRTTESLANKMPHQCSNTLRPTLPRTGFH
jgi:amidase